MTPRKAASLLRAHDQLQALTREVVFAATDAEYHRLVMRIRSKLKRLGPDFEQRFREAVDHTAHRPI